jgi:streptogramin lyase
MDLESGQVRTVAGNGTKGAPADGEAADKSPLVDPRAVASDSQGNQYILERGGHALRVVRPDGTIHTVAGTGEKGFRDGEGLQAQFGSPKHICCDPDDKVYIADDLNGAVRQYDPETGQVSTILGRGFGDARITLEHPHGVRWHSGSLYVVDTGHNRILRVSEE